MKRSIDSFFESCYIFLTKISTLNYFEYLDDENIILTLSDEILSRNVKNNL